jgi:hypothetical protein
MNTPNLKIFVSEINLNKNKSNDNKVIPITENSSNNLLEDNLWSKPVKPQKELTFINKLTLIGYVFNMSDAEVFKFSKTTDKMMPYLTFIAICGAIISLLILYDVVDPKYSWISLLNYPVIIPRCLLTNIYLFKELCKCFETWFLVVNIMIAWWFICDIFNWGIITILLTVYCSMWIHYVFFDALCITPKKRIFIMSLQLFYLFSTVIVINMKEDTLNIKDISVFRYFKYNTKSIFTDRILILLFFDLRHLFQTIIDKNAFIILKSKLISCDRYSENEIKYNGTSPISIILTQ